MARQVSCRCAVGFVQLNWSNPESQFQSMTSTNSSSAADLLPRHHARCKCGTCCPCALSHNMQPCCLTEHSLPGCACQTRGDSRHNPFQLYPDVQLQCSPCTAAAAAAADTTAATAAPTSAAALCGLLLSLSACKQSVQRITMRRDQQEAPAAYPGLQPPPDWRPRCNCCRRLPCAAMSQLHLGYTGPLGSAF